MAQSVSRSEVTAAEVSAIMVPMPCAPCWSFTMAGVPPMNWRARSTDSGERAHTVFGTSMSLRVRSCMLRSLSRERAIATAVFRTGMPIMSNWRTTASP